jgi:hypothetical protein
MQYTLWPSRGEMETLERHLRFTSGRAWGGYDPYDALLSPIAHLPLLGRSRLFRLAFTQLLKRSIVNFRPLLGIRPGINPKGLALFLSSMARCGPGAWAIEQIPLLASKLTDSRTLEYPGAGWGYNFPWQSRQFYLPAGTPTVVVTSFAGGAFLDAHAVTGDKSHLAVALEACRFVLEAPHRTTDATGTCLSYSPLDRSAVYNASLLGARLLVRAGQQTKRADLLDSARPLFSYALARQRADGSWGYGEASSQGWVDSFHTGFVLEALEIFRKATRDPATEKAVRQGSRFYVERLFGPRGEPYYFPERHYPYDIHSAAQGVLTLLELSDLVPEYRENALLVGRWMVENMLGEDGFFHYQIRRTHRVRIPYMRWSQAWGVRALAELARRGIEL